MEKPLRPTDDVSLGLWKEAFNKDCRGDAAYQMLSDLVDAFPPKGSEATPEHGKMFEAFQYGMDLQEASGKLIDKNMEAFDRVMANGGESSFAKLQKNAAVMGFEPVKEFLLTFGKALLAEYGVSVDELSVKDFACEGTKKNALAVMTSYEKDGRHCRRLIFHEPTAMEFAARENGLSELVATMNHEVIHVFQDAIRWGEVPGYEEDARWIALGERASRTALKDAGMRISYEGSFDERNAFDGTRYAYGQLEDISQRLKSPKLNVKLGEATGVTPILAKALEQPLEIFSRKSGVGLD